MSVERAPRVAIVAASLDILGGQGVQARSLVDALGQDGCSVTFLPINPVFPRGLRWLRRIRYVRTVANQAMYLPRLATLAAADVAHVFSASYASFLLAPLPAMAAARAMNKRVVLHYHSGEADDHLSRWGALVHPWLGLADEIVVPSKYLAEVFARHGYRARVIPNVVDLSRFEYRPRRPLRPALLSTRNLEPYYRVDVALEAFARIKRARPDATLTVAGYGSEESRLRRLAIDGVSFVGKVEPSAMPALYDSADIFLNASEVDNQPVSILEAFASGLPVMSTPSGDIPAMVRHGDTGVLIPFGDAQALASAVLSLLDQPERALSMTERGREAVAHHTWPAVKGDWDDVYRGSFPTRRADGSLAIGRIGRLRRMPAAEIAGRLRQQGLKYRDRFVGRNDTDARAIVRRHASAIAEPAAALEWLRHDAPRRFFAGAADPVTAIALRDRCPSEVADLIGAGETLLQKRFDLLGYGSLSFGDPIDWQLDPVHGRRAPALHWSRIDTLDPAVVGDSKIIWELNRHQWIVRLAQAYALTGDERYAAACVTAIESWIAANPYGRGINWASSLEIALRLIAWCWTLVLIRQSKSVTGEWLVGVLASAWQHTQHVRRYLSHYFSPNTHLTGEALGLFYAGVFFAPFDRADQWRDVGSAVLIDESRRQVTPDGLHFERATGYHRYTAEIHCQLLLLASRTGIPIPAELRARTERLLDAMLALVQPDGNLSSIGDDDGGWLLPLAPRSTRDPRGLFGVGAAHFGRSDFAWAARGFAPELLWLTGVEGAGAFDDVVPHPPAGRPSRLLPSGGYAVMRSGWESTAHQLVIDVGPLGCSVSAAHGHADLLSVQCVVAGEPVLIDAGTGCYTAEPRWRNHFRGTAAHSALMIDGRSQVEPTGAFSWHERPAARLRQWRSDAAIDLVEAEHDAYNTPPRPVRHRRRVVFVKPDYWLIVDDLEGTGPHEVELLFQCAPIEVGLVDERWARAVTSSGRVVWLSSLSTPRLTMSVGCGEVSPIRGWISPGYGIRQPAPAIRCIGTVTVPWRAITVLYPDRTRSASPPDADLLAKPLESLDLSCAE